MSEPRSEIEVVLFGIANEFEQAGHNATWTGQQVADALRAHALHGRDSVLSNRSDDEQGDAK